MAFMNFPPESIGWPPPASQRFDIIIRKVRDIFIQEMNDCFDESAEHLEIKDGPFDKNGKFGECGSRTLYIYKYRRLGSWLYLKKETVCRNVLRMQFGEVAVDPPQMRFGRMFNYYEYIKCIRCELFLADPRLREIAERVFEPLAKSFPLPSVYYTEQFTDLSAWYPGERPELPKARLLK